MTSIKVNFEIGHEASIRTKKTPEGFTHDWEVFVRGQEGADISHFVDKVVFLLHETFPKPKRVVKEPPFSVKESGYAGFLLPIEIYLKNKDEPKKIKFTYDLTLQQSGFLKDRYVFQNPSDEFKKKLLKGGGIIANNNAFYTNPDQESRSRDSFSEDKHQLVSKPKASVDSVKKHKVKEHKEEVPYKTASSFENLFGPPIHKTSKVSPEPKKVDKNLPSNKPDKKEKDKLSVDKIKTKHDHKESKPEKSKNREDKEKAKMDKMKSHKDVERSKDKTKRPSDRIPTPESAKKRIISPSRRPPSPPPQRSGSASSFKEDFKPQKLNMDFDSKKSQDKLEDKVTEAKPDKEYKEKKKKDKKSHDKDKDKKEKREHKKEYKVKESPKEIPKEKPREVFKEKEPIKECVPLVKEKMAKPEKSINKFSVENLKKTPQHAIEKEEYKPKDKPEAERKHKHKKKDKKRDESRDKHKDSKEKKHKHDKVKDTSSEKQDVVEHRETPVAKDRHLLEPGSPISIDTASQCSSKSGIAKSSQGAVEEINSSHSDSEESLIAEDVEPKIRIEQPSPEPPKDIVMSPEQDMDIDPEPEIKPADLPTPQKEKVKKHKDKSKREEKKRKRKEKEDDEESRKIAKINELAGIKSDSDQGECSSAMQMETKLQDNGVSSSLGEDAEPGEISPDYMVQLRGLKQRIMTIKNDEDLERIANLIYETGRYEITKQTIDFDLCHLDRSTVQQLIQLVGC